MQLLLDTVNFWITRFDSALGPSKNPGISKSAFLFASGHILPKPALWRTGTVMRAPQLFTCLSGWWVLWSLCFSFCFLVLRQPFLTGDRDQDKSLPRPVVGRTVIPLISDEFLCPGSLLFLNCEWSWGRSESCLARVALLSGCLCWPGLLPTAADVLRALYSPVIASHSLCRLTFTLFLMGVKKMNSGRGGNRIYGNGGLSSLWEDVRYFLPTCPFFLSSQNICPNILYVYYF